MSNDRKILSEKLYLKKFLLLKDDQIFKKNHKNLHRYLLSLLNEFSNCVSIINKDSFWEIFPKIIGLDSKLQLLQFYIRLENTIELPDVEIIQIIERDYLEHNKELLDHGITSDYSESIIFKVD